MLDGIRSFFNTRVEPVADAAPEDETGRIQLAACALLLELANADEEFSAEERTHIESALQRHFGLPADTVGEMIRLADEERANSIDHFQFTNLITSNYDLGQKMVFAEVMWGLVLADGKIAEHEQYLMRKIANLLDLQPGYLSQARKNAATRID
ncbi:MAG TPA: TerB family tellurite resistance protein [Longimicrobiaceae bacterium]|nr:TerB family tellurite resistance protein [Longimicrobiaceae bacterium]